eukprot:gene9710-23752_t
MTAMGNGKMKMGAPDGAEVSPEKRFKLALVEEVESSESRDVGGKAVPLVYKCNDATAPQADVLGWITANQEEVEAKLKDHGAILFRGFPLQTAADFDKFVCAFKGWKDLSYDDSLSFAVRIKRSNRICTTNEGKTGGLVFHHEQAQSPKWPSKLFFCCELAAKPGDGGQTGVCRSDSVLQALEEAEPAFIRKCEELGVKYTIYMADTSTATGVGRSWKSYFSAETKEACEAKMKGLGYTWEWQEDGSLKATTPRLEAVAKAPGTETRCFFNQLPASLFNAKEFCKVEEPKSDAPFSFDPWAPVHVSQEALNKCLSFGDGSEISVEILEKARRFCEENAVNLQWQSGDIALLDNFLVMHARRYWNGPAGTRKLLASLVH